MIVILELNEIVSYCVFNLFYALKAETSKKRATDSATKTPVSSKKAKTATPQKTGIFLIFLYDCFVTDLLGLFSS